LVTKIGAASLAACVRHTQFRKVHEDIETKGSVLHLVPRCSPVSEPDRESQDDVALRDSPRQEMIHPLNDGHLRLSCQQLKNSIPSIETMRFSCGHSSRTLARTPISTSNPTRGAEYQHSVAQSIHENHGSDVDRLVRKLGELKLERALVRGSRSCDVPVYHHGLRARRVYMLCWIRDRFLSDGMGEQT
jgi:hypothetical protein